MRSSMLVLPLLFAAPAWAQEVQTIEVEGMAAVINGDIGMARDKAVDEAKRKAVEQVVGTTVQAESVAVDFQLVQEKITSRASGFVKSYEIKTQYKDGDTYIVKLKAQVDARAIADETSQLFSVKPRVLVLIAEQNVGGGSFNYWWGSRGFSSEMDIMQSSLIGQWQPKGFKFVDPSALQGRVKVTKAMQRADLDTPQVLSLGKNADADIAIVGKVVVTDAGTVMEGVKMRSFHAVGNLKVINIDTGEILAVNDDTAVAAHIDGNVGGRNAIKALAEKIGGALQTSIMKRWTGEAAGAQSLEVVVKGALKPADLKALTAMLTSEVRGVERVDVRKKTKDTVFLDVSFKGTSKDFSGSVEDKKIGDLTIEVEEMTKAKLVLSVAKAKG